MNGGHQTALDAPLVVQHFGHGRQAVGGARGVGHNGLTGIRGVVNAKHEHGGVVFGRCRHQYFFSASSQVFFGRGFV